MGIPGYDWSRSRMPCINDHIPASYIGSVCVLKI